MAEHGIIFCAEMVRALVDGRKTQTRRFARNIHQDWFGREGIIDWAPYHVGDYLWIRETFYYRDILGKEKVPKLRPAVRHKIIYKADDQHGRWKWHSSRFMPKWVARIWLEVTGVKAERLQDISEEDAIAEGFKISGRDGRSLGYSWTEIFRATWDNLHKKPGETWADNPWVFAYTLKRIEKGA